MLMKKCETAWCSRLRITDGNTYLNFEHRHKYSKGISKNISETTHTHVLMDHGKDRKHASKRKWTESEYHVQ